MAYYNLKDLISDEQVFISGSHICPHCQQKVTRKGMPIAFKFFAKGDALRSQGLQGSIQK
jgi:hypothetical protein